MAAVAQGAAVMKGIGMNGAPESVAKAAEAQADLLRERVRARIAHMLPGATVRIVGEDIEIVGRDAIRRWVATDALRDWREEEA